METGRLCCSGTNGLLTSGFSSSTRGERDTILILLSDSPPTHAVHLVMIKISVGRDPKILTAAATVENSILYAPMAENSTVFVHGPMSTSQLTLFQNLQILRTISFGHDIIHSPAPFSVWTLLWQLPLSYPLHACVKLHPMTMLWTKRLEYFKVLPNWMIKYD